MDPTQNEMRRKRLQRLAEESLEVYDDDAQAALDRKIPVPRYALQTSEGSGESTYRDNPNLTVHETLDEMGAAASGEASDGWVPNVMRDLETGLDLDWRFNIVVTAPQAVTS